MDLVDGDRELLDSIIDKELDCVAECFVDSRSVGVLLGLEKELKCCILLVETRALVSDEDLFIAIGVWVDAEGTVDCFVDSVEFEAIFCDEELTSVDSIDVALEVTIALVFDSIGGMVEVSIALVVDSIDRMVEVESNVSA